MKCIRFRPTCVNATALNIRSHTFVQQEDYTVVPHAQASTHINVPASVRGCVPMNAERERVIGTASACIHCTASQVQGHELAAYVINRGHPPMRTHIYIY